MSYVFGLTWLKKNRSLGREHQPNQAQAYLQLCQVPYLIQLSHAMKEDVGLTEEIKIRI